MIERMWSEGARAKDIAQRLAMYTTTIYNELKRGQTGEVDKNQRLAYSADVAERTLQEGFKRRGRRSGRAIEGNAPEREVTHEQSYRC